MKMTDLRAKARAIFGSAIAEPMPNQPNGAKALQERANARPIPTYKVGGVVKKQAGGRMMPPPPSRPRGGSPEADDVLITTPRGRAMEAELRRREAEKERALAAKRARADRMLGIPAQKKGGKAGCYADGGKVMQDRIAARMAAGNYKKGGKIQKKADGGILDRVGQAISDMASSDRMKRYGRPVGDAIAATGRGARAGAQGQNRGSNSPVTVTRREESITVTPKAPKTETIRLNEKPKYVKLNAHKSGGKVQTSSDTARNLAKEMGGMKKGGKAKSGLAVMIAIGAPMKGMKKPIKEKATGEMYSSKKAMKKHEAAESAGMERMERKMNGGAAQARDINMEGSKLTSRMMKGGGKAGCYAAGGAGKVRKGQAPIKKAQGGAAKVRKGMMSPTGDIKQVVKPKKGLGGF